MKKLLPLLLLALVLVACNETNSFTYADLFISDADEKEIGAQYHSVLKDTLTLLDANHPMSRYIDSLGSAIAKVQDRPNFSASDFSFFVVDEDVINAFAVPGGYIYFYKGLIERATTGDQIAGVMAHEIGHVAAEHYKEQAVKTSAIGFLAQLLGGENSYAQLAANVSAYLTQMKMSRNDEDEADSLSVAYTTEMGNISPWGMKSFLEILADESGPTLEIVSSHPDSEERAKEVERLITTVHTSSKNLPDGTNPKPSF